MDDDVTTDHILPGTSDILRFRSNVPRLAEFTLSQIDETFVERIRESDGGVLVAGDNYGQGSSWEHAALCRMYLGIEAVLAQSIARIHRANLFNFGIVPLLINTSAHERTEQGDDVEIVDDVAEVVRGGRETVTVHVTDEWEATAELDASERERDILAAGGKLPQAKQNQEAAD